MSLKSAPADYVEEVTTQLKLFPLAYLRYVHSWREVKPLVHLPTEYCIVFAVCKWKFSFRSFEKTKFRV